MALCVGREHNRVDNFYFNICNALIQKGEDNPHYILNNFDIWGIRNGVRCDPYAWPRGIQRPAQMTDLIRSVPNFINRYRGFFTDDDWGRILLGQVLDQGAGPGAGQGAEETHHRTHNTTAIVTMEGAGILAQGAPGEIASVPDDNDQQQARGVKRTHLTMAVAEGREAVVAVLETADPADMRALSGLLAGLAPSARLRAVLGKTEGNGCVNDFTRSFASASVRRAVAIAQGEAAGEGVTVVMSGETEGVLTPHLVAFADVALEAGQAPGRVRIGVARTRVLLPEEIGTLAQVKATREAVAKACADAGIEAKLGSLHYAQVKCPLLTSDRVAEAKAARGAECATQDTYHSMGLSRAASALGVALATGEVTEGTFSVDALARDYSLSSSVAAASAGIELMESEVMVLGEAKKSSADDGAGTKRGRLRLASTVMRDAIDAQSVLRCVHAAGLTTEYGQLDETSKARLVAVLVKADPAPVVRGHRTTMLTVPDIHATRHARSAVGGLHARSAVGGLLAGIFGRTSLFVSGGAEHQGPEGGGPLLIVYRD